MPSSAEAGYGPRIPVGRQKSIVCPSNAIAIEPGADIQTAVNAHAPGSTFCLEVGTFTRQQIVPKSSDRFIGMEGGAVLDGQGKAEHAFTGHSTGITIVNLLIEHYATIKQDAPVDPGYSGGSDWTLRNNEVAGNTAAGLDGGSGDTYVANYIHENGEEGFKANGSGETWTDNVISDNYPVPNSEFASIGEIGGGKSWETTGLVMSYNYIHDNGGPGIWDDNNTQRAVITYNDIENNQIGILHEISWDAVISNNYLKNNADSASSCKLRNFWCAEININNSGGVDGRLVTVRDNVLVPSEYGAGIILLNQKRGTGLYGPQLVQNVEVFANSIALSTNARMGAVDIDGSDPAMFASRGNSFDYDAYTSGAGAFYWSESSNQSGDFSYFQSCGQELDGTAF